MTKMQYFKNYMLTKTRYY